MDNATAKHVLLAEDNRTNQALASMLLKNIGYTVSVADNGRQALAMLISQSFDLALMDINMPELDGFEVTRRLRANSDPAVNNKLPIIAMTSLGDEDIRKKCLDAGMNGYVKKPVQAELLFAAIGSLMVKPQPAAPSQPAAAETVVTASAPAEEILIADDSPEIRKMLQSCLQDWGYNVVTVNDGESAWEIMQKPDAPQILLLDWVMPGMDGLELCKKIRAMQATAYVYIILISARSSLEQRTEGFNAGADDYLIKPLKTAELKARIEAGIRILHQGRHITRQRDYLKQELQLGQEQSTQYAGLIHFMTELDKQANEAEIIETLLWHLRETLKIRINIWEHLEGGDFKSLNGTQESLDPQHRQTLLAAFTADASVIFSAGKPKYLKETDCLIEIVAIEGEELGLDMLPLYMNHFRLSLTAARQRTRIAEEQTRYRALMENILPKKLAEELLLHGRATPRFYANVTVVFTDFVGFTKIANDWPAERVVRELGQYFDYFDRVVEKYHVEKLKTLGDGYMYAGGLPDETATHAADCVLAALEIKQFVTSVQERMRSLRKGHNSWGIRIGIHTGPVMAGIIGAKKFAYDIWGDTVNTASRMESHGEAGAVNISEATYRLVRDHFSCEYRGQFDIKGKGLMNMYRVKGKRQKL
ncbi:MAG: response regulator [Gammaproteobacteria bacterium]|nr:response regulator [Gammaproteobacteria bacterium]